MGPQPPTPAGGGDWGAWQQPAWGNERADGRGGVDRTCLRFDITIWRMKVRRRDEEEGGIWTESSRGEGNAVERATEKLRFG